MTKPSDYDELILDIQNKIDEIGKLTNENPDFPISNARKEIINYNIEVINNHIQALIRPNIATIQSIPYDYDKFKTKDFFPLSKYIWINKVDGTYHFVDETDNFQGPYNSEYSCQLAYKRWCKELL